MTEVEKVMKLTGEKDAELTALVYEDAVSEVLAQTRRTHLIEPLRKTVRDMAVIALNRMGTEGEAGRSEGGESYSFTDMPEHITAVINAYRLARIGGRTYETPADETKP